MRWRHRGLLGPLRPAARQPTRRAYTRAAQSPYTPAEAATRRAPSERTHSACLQRSGQTAAHRPARPQRARHRPAATAVPSWTSQAGPRPSSAQCRTAQPMLQHELLACPSSPCLPHPPPAHCAM
eukprot:2440248-Prymnesium_polylepis.1